VYNLALSIKTKTMKPQAKLAIVLILVMYLVGLLQDINSL
jgi:hypothetical protein